MGFAIVEEKVFLGVIEVGLEGDAGVRLEEGRTGAAEMDAVVLGASLEEDAGRGEGGQGEGGEEVAEKGGCWGRVSKEHAGKVAVGGWAGEVEMGECDIIQLTSTSSCALVHGPAPGSGFG